MSKKPKPIAENKNKYSQVDAEIYWQDFAQQNNLTQEGLTKFQQYYNYFIEYNKLHNLTAITDLPSILNLHFSDSLALENLLDLKNIQGLADIGSGGGFPGLPLKIKYPHLNLFLIEVNQKKQEFLNNLISQLELSNCTVSPLDWRTFLRQTDLMIDFFCARASLQPEELIRIFKPTSPYRNSKLVYWASKKWVPSDEVKDYMSNETSYTVDDKIRKLVLFENI